MIWRPALRWLMHSPLRFALVVAAVLAVLVLIAQLGGGDRPLPQAAPPAPPPTSARPSTTAPPSPSTTAPPALPSSPRAAAEGFAKLWASPEMPRSEWWARLRPLATEEYAAVGLAQVDPGNVPARSVSGPATVVSESSGAASVTVPLDALAVSVQLTNDGGGWRVADLQPASGS